MRESQAPDDRIPKPYASALDVPSIRRMLNDVKALKVATRFLSRDQHTKVVALEAEIQRLGETVDKFYQILGDRNWVFHDELDVDVVKRLLNLPADEAERALVESYQDVTSLRFKVRRLGQFPELRARMDLIEHAETDFHAGRYYAVVQVLLSVMDGFVNDLDAADRRGLHAREPDELQAWDSVVGHHLGLTNAHRSFTKTFKKRSDKRIVELYRHGIVHGMLTNYDNDVVAAKAWNRLFALADWASSLAKHRTPPEPRPSLRETARLLVANARARRALDAWTPWNAAIGDPGFDADELVSASRRYLDAWRSGNFGVMASHISQRVAEPTVGRTAGLIRETLDGLGLDNYELTAVKHSAPAVAQVDVDIDAGGSVVPCRLRWVRGGADGMGVAPNEDGEWRLISWSFWAMKAERQEAFPPG